MDYSLNRDQRSGLTGTILFHAILLILFIFFLKFRTPLPLPEEQGIVVNFGTTDEGKGEVEAEPAKQIEKVIQPVVKPSAPTPPTNTVKEVVTQNIEESVNMEKTEVKPVIVPVPVEKKVEEKKPSEDLSKAMEAFKNRSKPAGGGSEGITNPGGNQGSKEGVPNAPNYGKGSGAGDKFSYSLKGRKMLIDPKIKDTSQDQGTVVVSITVDKYGKVVRAVSGARGSTTSSEYLYKLAREAALKSIFDPNPEAPEEQTGTMTFVFVLE